MKKIALAALVTTVVAFTSCEKQLTQDPIGLTTLEETNSTPTLGTVETSVNSSYQLLSNRLNILAQWDWAGGLVFQNDLVLQDIASDDAEKKWNPDGDQPWMDDINNFTFTSTNGGPNGLWKYNYEGIKRLNIAIELLTKSDIEAITGITTARKNQLLGEAYFLRSYYYFSLVTNFGGVPLILGSVILSKAFKTGKKKSADKIKRISFLGLGGGFIDAVGGSGWGSIVLSTLIAGGRHPRFSLGTVKLSRFFIALTSSLTFITMLNGKHWEAVAGLVIGSALASPVAARISNKISAKAIMFSVAVIVILISLRSIVNFILKVI